MPLPRNPGAERIVLGRTGLEVFRLGFGGIPIQRVSEAEAVQTVSHAIERGVDFIDTSRAYTTSERRIGLALKQTDTRVIVASKSHAKTAVAVRADLETSLRELGRDYIDLYQCHFVSSPADYLQVTGPGGALEGLRRAQEEGLIGYVGITSHSLDVLDRSLDDGLFDTIMVCFSFLEPRARETVIPKAVASDVGVIAMKPFSGGVIDDVGLALRYALSEPGVLVLAGVEDPGLFDEDWRIFQEGESLSESDKDRIAEIRQSYDKVFCRRCDYCQPCTEGIPIQIVVNVRSLVKRMGKEVFKQSPLWGDITKGANCTDCGECTTRCPYGLPIPDLIRESLRWLEEVYADPDRQV
jgi:predicted aldo/keto reductase-like oxidoreductase